MRNQRLFSASGWLLFGLLALTNAPVWGQVRPYDEKDKVEIINKAKTRISKDLPERINNLVVEDITEAELEYLIKNCYTLNESQLFINDQTLIEDDVDPNHIGPAPAGSSYDKTVSRYLNDLLSFYTKNPDPNKPSFVISQARSGDLVVESPTSVLIDFYYDSVFKGKHKATGRAYQTIHRKATLQATREGNSRKWTVLIRQIIFLRPPKDIAQVTATAPVTATVAVAPPPALIDIREPQKVYNQADYDFNVTIRYNKKALDVIQSDSPRVPLGQYRLDDAGTYELAGNSIRFDETDKNKFTYKNRDRDIMGFALLQPPKPAPAIASKPLPDVVTPGYLPPNEDQRKRKPEPPVSTSTAEVAAVSPDKTTPPTPTKTAAETSKQLPKPVVEPPRSQPTVPPAPQIATNKPAESSKPPVVEATKPVTTKPAVDPPKPVDKPVVEPPKAVGVTVRQAEPTKPAADVPKLPAAKPAQLPVAPPVEKPAAPAPPKADVSRVAEQEKSPKPIIQKPVALSVSPALKKALTSEQQRIVAGMRLRGWMQVIGGLAALGGSYVAYSGLKKDYDAYSQKVNALNTEYNLYRDLSRREIPPPPNALSMTQYGSPTIYGVYGGGAIGLGLTVNGLRTLFKAGKMGKKK